MQTTRSTKVKLSILIVTLLIIDFVSKFLATKYLPLSINGMDIPMTKVNDEISLLLIRHYKDMAMIGLGHNISLIIMGFLAIYFLNGAFNSPKTYQKIAFALFLGGYGNILEIAYRDYATDFIYFEPLNKLISNHIYIFNVADILICSSVIVFIVGTLITISAWIISLIRTKKNVDISTNE